MYVLCCIVANDSIGKGKVMNFKAVIENLTRIIGKAKPNYNAFRKALKDSVGLPASYNAATYGDWKSKMGSMPGYALDVLKLDSTDGKRRSGIEALAKELFDPKRLEGFLDETMPKQEKERVIAELKLKAGKIEKEIGTVFGSLASTFKLYEKAFESGDDSQAIDISSKGKKGKRISYDGPEKVALRLMELVKNNRPLSDIKTYLSSNLTKSADKNKAFRILNSKGQMIISKIIYSFESGSDASLKNLIQEGFVGFNIAKAQDDLRKDPDAVLDILKNPEAFAARKKIPEERVAEVTANKGAADRFMDFVSQKDVLKSAFIANRSSIKTLTEAFVKEATDSKKQPSKMIFFMRLNILLRPFIQSHYNKMLNAIQPESISDKEYEAISRAVTKQIDGELSLAQDSFSDVRVKNLVDAKGRTIRVPNCVDHPILNVSEIGAVVTNRQEFTEKENSKELEEKILADTEKRLLRTVQQIPPMVAQKLQSLFRVNLKEKVFQKVKSYLASGKSLERFNLDGYANTIFTREGGILMSGLLKRALDEVEDRNHDQYSSTVHIRAILHFSKWSGTFRSKNKWLYETILKMQNILNHHSHRVSGGSLDELLQSKDLSDKHEDDPRNKKQDVTRGHRKEPNYIEIDEKKKLEKQRKINNLTARTTIKARYSSKESDLLNWRGEPNSPVARKLWAEYVKLFNENKAFRDIQSAIYVTPQNGFKVYVTNSENRGRIRAWRDQELRELEKNPDYINSVNYIHRMEYSDRYESMQTSLLYSAGSFNKNKFEPVPTREGLPPPADYWGDRVSKGRIKDSKLLNENQSEVDFRTQNSKAIPLELREKFQGYSLLGMVHRADSQEELHMVMNHIYDIVFTENRGGSLTLQQGETFDPLKELSSLEEHFGAVTTLDKHGEREIEKNSSRVTDVFIRRNKGFDAANKSREAEIQGLNNTPGVTGI